MQYPHLGSIGDFVLSWDAPYTQDIVLQKKCQSGEEIAISALLVPEQTEKALLGPESNNTSFPWDVTMKVCVKKTVLSAVLQFDCNISSNNSSGSEFNILRAYCLPSLALPTRTDYRGPEFR